MNTFGIKGPPKKWILSENLLNGRIITFKIILKVRRGFLSDIAQKIFGYLEFTDLPVVKQVSTQWNGIHISKRTWHNALLRTLRDVRKIDDVFIYFKN